MVSFANAIKLLMLLPGKLAQTHRSKFAQTLCQYYGGDAKLKAEIDRNAAGGWCLTAAGGWCGPAAGGWCGTAAGGWCGTVRSGIALHAVRFRRPERGEPPGARRALLRHASSALNPSPPAPPTAPPGGPVHRSAGPEAPARAGWKWGRRGGGIGRSDWAARWGEGEILSGKNWGRRWIKDGTGGGG